MAQPAPAKAGVVGFLNVCIIKTIIFFGRKGNYFEGQN
jgi:hypothetical protein